ncbi:MAG: T9SS type A sorting domain-containing protein [Bacteroidetes bacterium]|nr:T9SS type A sorting domain-containing protein [Bacteroidota bacterium]
MRISLILFVVLFCTKLLTAQTKDFDTKGTDFWLTFPPNIHQNGDDSLYIYIAADTITKGAISFPGQSTRTFVITDIKNIYTYRVSYNNYELLDGNSSETASNRTFHITTDNQVTVYGLSKADKTSDAFLVLPTDVLGLDYYVMSYNSDNKGDPITPSQFAIIATQDATKVTITLSTNRTSKTNLKTITTTLQKGQSYLVQANSSSNDDLTSSHISSNKPIAVVGSQQRAAIPYTNTSAARDFLIEQMIPVTTWGYDAFLVPFPEPTTGTGNTNNDIYRIIAARDNTQITLNGINLTTLKAGQMYQGILTQAAAISSSEPIMVALFKKSTNSFGNFSSRDSDPFMMLVPPAEQFLKSYKWINSQAYITNGWQTTTVYKEQFVIVVAPNSAIQSIRLDNKVTSVKFTAIPTSSYSYATISVTDGVHSISANEGIGIYVFGYGPADSYGYIGGMNMINTAYITSTVKPLDITASPGEVVNLPLILDSVKAKPTIQSAGVDHFTAKLRFNATLLTSLEESQRGIIENGIQTITVTGSYTGQTKGDTLAVVPLVAGLGDSESTPIDMLEFHWFGIAGDTIASTNGLKSAVFTLKDVFNHPKDGKRLINPQEGSISLSIEPNPSSTLPVSINVGGDISANATLIIYNSIGRQIVDISNQLRTAFTGANPTTSFQFTQPNLPKGLYFVRLASDINSIVRPFVFE